MKGLISLEGLLCLMIFLSIVFALQATEKEQLALFSGKTRSLMAKARAEACALVVDEIYSNSLKEFNGVLDCMIKEGKVISSEDEVEEKEFIINNKTKLTEGEKLSIQRWNHYG